MSMIQKINDNWTFCKQGGNPQEATLPHTWNAADCFLGQRMYDRTVGTYEKTITIEKAWEQKRIFLQFGGACQRTRLRVNDKPVIFAKDDIYARGTKPTYEHRGGFGRFRYEITEQVHPGTNTLRVQVDNIADAGIAPLGGDFNCQGGLYRDVALVITEPVHIDLLDDGADGVYFTPKKMPDCTDYTVHAKIRIKNDTAQQQKIFVRMWIRHPKNYEVVDDAYIKHHLRFSPDQMCDGKGELVAEFAPQQLTLDAWKGGTAQANVLVRQPKLWDGLDHPYQYEVVTQVYCNEELCDEKICKIGFRSIEIPSPTANAESGKFYLNGREYVLRGAGKHQDYGFGADAKGFAVTEIERNHDAGIMVELGMNAVRLVHYQHAEEEIELYDRLGIAVWSELGVVGSIMSETATQYPSYLACSKQQLKELIKQQYNHPAVMVWSLSNEVSIELDDDLKPIPETEQILPTAPHYFGELDKLAHELDNSRLTTYAVFSVFGRKKDWASDTFAINLYPYWYDLRKHHGGAVTLTDMIHYNFGLLKENGACKPMGLSEYGASAMKDNCIEIRADGTVEYQGDMAYTESYQAYLHEKVYDEMCHNLPFLWCSFVWQLFDSSSYKKFVSMNGVNDKGLVAIDHETKKDAVYFYKANWNTIEPFVHVVNAAYEKDGRKNKVLKAYSNAQKLQLYVDGMPFGNPITDTNPTDALPDELHIFRWYGVPENRAQYQVEIVD